MAESQARVAATEKRVTALEQQVQRLLDHAYGTNVRPALKERGEDDTGAEIDTQGA